MGKRSWMEAAQRPEPSPAPAWRSSVRMSFSLADLPPQRRRLRCELEQRQLPVDTAYDASLVLGELVSNALQHGVPLGDGNLVLCWGAWEGQVHVEVTDGGAGTVPVAGTAAPVATRGRGLAIVAALAIDWGVREATTSRTVWAALPVKFPAQLEARP